MWALDEELERHFDKIKEQRSSGNSMDDEDEERGPTIQNEYARGRRSR